MGNFWLVWALVGFSVACAVASDKGQSWALRAALLAAAAFVYAALRFGAVPALDGVVGYVAAAAFGKGFVLGLALEALLWLAGAAVKRFAPGSVQVVAGADGKAVDK